MIIDNPQDYKLIGFRKSKTLNKKYDAILENKDTGRLKHVPFGDLRYEHYRDSTPLKLYSKLDHLDPQRRMNYRTRHASDINNKFSSGWFSNKYLW